MRFMHEAQAAGRLHHPGIVAIFDVGECTDKGDPYIVLEYVAGEALNRILAREKKLPLETALRLAEEIAEALDYAHAQGVIHRDIKPANILLTEDGHAKIADFGIAKLNLAHFTLPGRVLGTPAYMAPEQLSGEGVDGRSDLFSLGVILYSMVTGQSPFHGDSATTVCFKVANREPLAASTLDLTVPRELDEVIGRAMAKDRQERYQRGAEFAEDLRQLQQILKPASTTSSLRAAAARTGTRSTGLHIAKPGQAAGRTGSVAGKVKAANAATPGRWSLPIRDMILGLITVIILVVAGVESKLFVASPKVNINTSEAAPTGPPGSVPTNAPPTAVTNVAQPAAAEPPSAPPHKIRAAAPRPAKQIVVPLSTLDLAVQHQFKDATLFVWVDDKLMLTRPLHGATQKHLVVFNGLRGVESDTLKIPAGKHVVRVRALSADETIDLSKSVSSEFIGGGDKSLQVTIDKHNTVMRLAWGQ